MPNLNKVILMGNLTSAPELRYTKDKTPVCSFGLAINRQYRDDQGNKHDDVCFVDCEAWASTGQTINEHLVKGRPILVEGRLKLDQWKTEKGENRSKLKVVIERVQFIDRRQRGDNSNDEDEKEAVPGEAVAASTEQGDIHL